MMTFTVDSVVSHNTVSSEEESSGEQAPASISSFASTHGRPVFPSTMSLNRFKLIRTVLRFDNVSTRQGRLARDKLAAVWLFFTALLQIVRKQWLLVSLSTPTEVDADIGS